MEKIIEQYKKWKTGGGEDWKYDYIEEFFSELFRSEMVEIMEWIEKNYKQ